ncbi:MAG: DMT family transporter [Candidatus Heimdallarchaeota archaeon]|nr:DMT family transporter [Candidatus Heimdallarchaeota archaeon]
MVIVWGISWPIGRIIALSDFGVYPFTISFIRYAFALPVLYFFTRLLEKEVVFPRHLWKRIFVLGLLQISLYQLFFLIGLRYTSSSDGVLIINGGITIITAIVASKVYVSERMSRNRIIGVSLAFLGVFIIFLYTPNTDTENRVLGNILIMLAAIAFGLYTVFSKPIYEEITPLNFQFWATLSGWLVLTLFSVVEQINASAFLVAQVESDILLWIMFLGIIAAALGNTLFSIGVKHIGPTRSALFINLMPIAGVLAASVMLDEEFSFIYVISFVVIFLGIYIEKRG